MRSVFDYYPFGLSFNSYKRENSISQNFKFNGVEFQPDLGLDMYQTLFRLYDPAIGRFHQIDPLADFFPGINPYSFGFNNPILYGDPDGLGPIKDLWRKIKEGVMSVAGYRKQGSWKADNVEWVKKPGKEKGRSDGNSSPSPSSSQVADQRSGISLPSVSPLSGNFTNGQPSFDVNISPVSVPEPRPMPVIDGRAVDAETSIKFNNSPFGGNSSKILNPSGTNSFLNPIAQALKDAPHLAVTIIIQTNLSREQLDQVINFDGNTKNGTLSDLLGKRGQAIQRVLISLGTDPKQVVYMYLPDSKDNSIRIKFRERK